jgi:hypothetical protein
MKRTLIIMTLLLVLGITMVVQGENEDGDWEYANIQFDSFGTWFWREPAVYAEGEELDDLCSELSIILHGNDEANLHTVVNWAGSKGWELVSMNQSPTYISVWFKRGS